MTKRSPAERRKRLIGGVAVVAVAATVAGASAVRAAGWFDSEPKLLPPEQAFRLSARGIDPTTVELRYDIVDGYYLYRDKLSFNVTVEPPTVEAAPKLPPGKRKHDEFFGDVETYRGRVIVTLSLAHLTPGQTVSLEADSQGCADAGVCYPPMRQQLKVRMPSPGAGAGPIAEPASGFLRK